MLRGGVREEQLTEICGCSASGKTQVRSGQLHCESGITAESTRPPLDGFGGVQLCLTLAATALQQGERVLIIDCLAAIRMHRLASILHARCEPAVRS